MSGTVTRRLQELADQGRQRRQHVAAIRHQSLLLLASLHRLREECDRPMVPSSQPGSAPAPAADRRTDGTILQQVEELLSGTVLEQVARLLQQVDTDGREHWSEEDARIVTCLQDAWVAAQRKGYTLEELQTILQALRPRQ